MEPRKNRRPASAAPNRRLDHRNRSSHGLFGTVALSFCLSLIISLPAAAQDAPPAPPFAGLPAETAKKLNDAFAKWVEAVAAPRQRLVEKRLLATVDELAKEFSLDGTSVATLREAAKKATDESRKPWEAVMIEWIEALYAEQLKQSGGDPTEFINDIVESMTDIEESDIESMLEEAPVSEKASPRNQPAWKAGLEKALSPEQLAKVNEQIELEKKQADKQLTDLRDRILKAAETELRAEIKPVADLLRNTIPMDEARRKAVDEAATAAVAQALESRKASLVKMLAKIPPSSRQQMMMNDINDVPILGDDGSDDAVPSEQKAWTEALAKILTADEAADWKKAREASEAEQKKKSDEQLARLIDTFSDNYRQNFDRQMSPLVADIRSSANLDAARIEKLTKAAEAAVNDAIEGWKAKATEAVGKMEAREREMMLQQGYVSVGWEDKNQPTNQKSWKDALDTLLTPDEKKLWEASIARRDDQRKQVATLILVSALDERLAFTSAQREKVQPLLAKTAEGQFAQRLEQQWGSMNFRSIVSNLQKADHDSIKQHLEDWQRKLWESQIENFREEVAAQQRRDKQEKTGTEPLPNGPDPVAAEAVLSGFLFEMLKKEREQIEARMTANANDLVRAAKLSPEKTRCLQIAVKGAAEDEVNGWFNNYNQWVRNQVGGNQNPQSIDLLLRGIGRVNFGRQVSAEETAPWKTVTARLLSEPELAAWQKEVSSRSAYRAKATVALILTQFDNSARITGEQYDKLSTLAHESLSQYGPDIERYFGNRDPDSPWELNSYYNLIVLEGIPEKTLREILTESQWKTWETEFRGRISGYWDTIKRYHEERIKKEKGAPSQPAKKS
jgi:hypothetical protein